MMARTDSNARTADPRPAFIPTWARGRDSQYHARTAPTFTLGDPIRLDTRAGTLDVRTIAARNAAESDR